jgi:glutathione S-transferase
MVMSATLELWQTEWCPASHRVRQCLTELGLSFIAHQVAVEPDARAELEAATGMTTIPILVADGEIFSGENAILHYLGEHFTEPLGASSQRTKAAKAKRKELEEACPKVAAATH